MAYSYMGYHCACHGGLIEVWCDYDRHIRDRFYLFETYYTLDRIDLWKYIELQYRRFGGCTKIKLNTLRRLAKDEFQWRIENRC